MTAPVNHIRTATGLVKAVCICCDKQSKATPPDKDGEPQLFGLAKGWSQAPFPAHFEHRDGSRGSTYTCPSCNRRLHKGERLRMRGGAGAAIRNAT
jgi:hypothetical protein